MTRISAVTESFASIPAQEIDSSVKLAQKHYDKAVTRTGKLTLELAVARETSSLESAKSSHPTEEATVDTIVDHGVELSAKHNAEESSVEQCKSKLTLATQEQLLAYEQLVQTLDKKKAFLCEGLLASERQVEEVTAIVAANPERKEELATVLMDKALIAAALRDIEAMFKELEKKQQGKRKRNPAPSKRSPKGSLEANSLTKEIVAVLAEADKVKTTKITKTDNSARYRLKGKYATVAVPELNKKFNYKNINETPRLEKVLINMGLGDVKDDGKKFNNAVDELKLIAGQKPIVTTAKKSIANFKVREGQNIGAKVTLRGNRMYEFLDKLISIALPRVRDFKGVSPNSFDGRGNYAMGIKEQLIFPEIKFDKIDKVRGFDIVIVTTAKTDEEAKELLSLLGMPYRA